MSKLHLIFSGLCVVATAACSPSSDAPSSTAPDTATQAPKVPASSSSAPSSADANEDAAVAKVVAAIQQHHLTSLSPDCLDYLIGDEDAQGIVVDVHEKHDGHCGGDPDVSPRLFSIRVASNGQLTSDAQDPANGRMTPLR